MSVASLGEGLREGSPPRLICRSCGRSVEVSCVVAATPDFHGFSVDEADVVFRGLCPDCRR